MKQCIALKGNCAWMSPIQWKEKMSKAKWSVWIVAMETLTSLLPNRPESCVPGVSIQQEEGLRVTWTFPIYNNRFYQNPFICGYAQESLVKSCGDIAGKGNFSRLHCWRKLLKGYLDFRPHSQCITLLCSINCKLWVPGLWGRRLWVSFSKALQQNVWIGHFFT